MKLRQQEIEPEERGVVIGPGYTKRQMHVGIQGPRYTATHRHTHGAQPRFTETCNPNSQSPSRPASSILSPRHLCYLPPTLSLPSALPGEVQRISRLRASSAAAWDAMEDERRLTASKL